MSSAHLLPYLHQAAGASYLFAAWGEKNAHRVGLPMRSNNLHARWVRRWIYDGKHEATKSGTHHIRSVVEMPLNYSDDGLIIFQMDSNSDSLSSMPVWCYGCVAAVQFIALPHTCFFLTSQMRGTNPSVPSIPKFGIDFGRSFEPKAMSSYRFFISTNRNMKSFRSIQIH